MTVLVLQQAKFCGICSNHDNTKSNNTLWTCSVKCSKWVNVLKFMSYKVTTIRSCLHLLRDSNVFIFYYTIGNSSGIVIIINRMDKIKSTEIIDTENI